MSVEALLVAVREHLRGDLDSWLPEGARVPRSFHLVPSPETLADQALPASQVSTAGLLGPPEQHAGVWWAEWSVGASVWCRAADWDSTQALTVTYAEAIVACLAAAPALAGADGWRWVDTRTGLPDNRTGRTLGGCVVICGYWLPLSTARPGDVTEAPPMTGHDFTVHPIPILKEAP